MSNYHRLKGQINSKKIIISYLSLIFSLLVLLVVVRIIENQVFYKSSASGESITPIVLPGSSLDTGIIAENFTDVDRNSWSWKYIQQISPIGIIPPKTSTEFVPLGEVTRADMSQFLLKTYKLITNQDPPIVETPFTDIQILPQDIQDTIAKIYGLQITAGTSGTTFSPDEKVNRAQMVTFFCNLYKAITGEFPPESDVPFTDIYDPDLEWSVKYIKKSYNLKITAGTTDTTFSPRENVTREQMATFIFNFMRLFGPSAKDSGFSSNLGSVKSVTFYPHPYGIESPYFFGELKSWLPEIKSTGFNTVWLVIPWKTLNPKPLAVPAVYDEAGFAAVIKTLDFLRQNNMKAIIGLNYLGKDYSPEGIDYCSWTTNLSAYQSFENYTQEFLRRIEGYSDMTYILFFTEGSEPCNLNPWAKENGQAIASLLRPTLGSLPQRLDPALRSKFKIGYHDHTLLNLNLSSGESPIQMPLSYDFYSTVTYDQEAKSDAEIAQALNSKLDNVKSIYPFIPVFVGEFGSTTCNISNPYYSYSSSAENQARVLQTGVRELIAKNIGFNIWQWNGKFYNQNQNCQTLNETNVVNPNVYGIAYEDSGYEEFPKNKVSKPARVSLMSILNPPEPTPTCIENPIYARNKKNSNDCYQFPSQCLPGGSGEWDVVSNCDIATPPPTIIPTPTSIPTPSPEPIIEETPEPMPSSSLPVSINDTPSETTSPDVNLATISPSEIQNSDIPVDNIQTPESVGFFDPIVRLYNSIVGYVSNLIFK